MKMLYTADLHGNLPFYHKLFGLAVKKKACVVVLGGDLLPKTVDYGIMSGVKSCNATFCCPRSSRLTPMGRSLTHVAAQKV